MPPSLLPTESWSNTSWADASRSVAPLSAARIAAIFDLHGRCAYSLAMLILGNPGRAEAATEEAFRSLRYDETARGDAGPLARDYFNSFTRPRTAASPDDHLARSFIQPR